MSRPELSPQYDPKGAEERWYAEWESRGDFTPSDETAEPVYTIVIPPPNVTGYLHIGHALQHTLMDILTRRKRMQGYRTLWLPGPHGDREGCSDWTGGTGAVCAWSGGAAIASASPRMRSRDLAMNLEPSPGGWPNSVRGSVPLEARTRQAATSRITK